MKKKGYRPVGAKEIRMPYNFYPRKISAERNEKKIQKGLKKAEEYARDILDGKSRWRRVPFLSDIMARTSKGKWVWNFFRKIYPFKVATAKCTQCGLCVKLCPVGNIKMEEYPVFQDRCGTCMRCVSFCPVQAIYVPGRKYKLYRAVEAKELVKD